MDPCSVGAGRWHRSRRAPLPLSPPRPSPRREFNARNGSTVTLGARVQAQFHASGSDETSSSFFIRRAWVTIDGRLNDWVSARAQYDIDGDKVLEAYLALNASENVQFQLGQFKRAISTFWLAANFDLPLIERDGHVPDVPPCPGLEKTGKMCSFGALTGGLGLDAYEPGHPAQRSLLRERQPAGDAHQRRGNRRQGT